MSLNEDGKKGQMNREQLMELATAISRGRVKIELVGLDALRQL